GLGYGPGGALWGCEFLLADYQSYRQAASLRPTAMPGGAAAVREPWRNTVAQVLAAMSWDQFKAGSSSTPLSPYLATKPVAALASMMRSKVNSPLASSAGRLFDAVAGALGLTPNRQTYEGEAASLLEALAASAWCNAEDDSHAYQLTEADCSTQE